jgi:hypothetical protein
LRNATPSAGEHVIDDEEDERRGEHLGQVFGHERQRHLAAAEVERHRRRPHRDGVLRGVEQRLDGSKAADEVGDEGHHQPGEHGRQPAEEEQDGQRERAGDGDQVDRSRPHQTDRQQLDAERQRDEQPEGPVRERMQVAPAEDGQADRRGGADGARPGQAAEGARDGATVGHPTKVVAARGGPALRRPQSTAASTPDARDRDVAATAAQRRDGCR